MDLAQLRYRSINPVLTKKTFAPAQSGARTMSISGVVGKVIFLCLIFSIAFAGYYLYGARVVASLGLPSLPPEATEEQTAALFDAVAAALGPSGVYAAILAVTLGLIVFAFRSAAIVLAPLFAAASGYTLGAVAIFVDFQEPGAVLIAVGLTLFAAFALLFLYATGLLKATENAKLGVTSALLALAGCAAVYFALEASGIGGEQLRSLSSLGGDPMIVVILGVIVALAAYNLVLDFDFIEEGIEMGAPKRSEWYAAFGIVVSLIWLYLSIFTVIFKLMRKFV